VEAAKAAAPGAPITLLAHSAGGWLGRLYLLDFDRAGIDRFVSLGSPHLPPPPGVVDQTRGILTFISKACPGAFHEEISYVTVAGRFIRGARLLGPGGWQQKVVGAGYQQVCGVADVWGDGVVPVPAAHLEGALQITLDGVYHSPLGSEEGSDSADVAQGSGIVSEEAAVVAAASAASDPEAADMVIDARLYDSDDYAATEKDMEEAAVEARPGPRLWYGSEGVLGRWAPLLWSSEPATMPEAVLKGWDI